MAAGYYCKFVSWWLSRTKLWLEGGWGGGRGGGGGGDKMVFVSKCFLNDNGNDNVWCLFQMCLSDNENDVVCFLFQSSNSE